MSCWHTFDTNIAKEEKKTFRTLDVVATGLIPVSIHGYRNCNQAIQITRGYYAQTNRTHNRAKEARMTESHLITRPKIIALFGALYVYKWLLTQAMAN